MRKLLKYSLILLVLLLIGGYFYVQSIKKSALPDYDQNIHLTGLTDKVTVYRDAHGVPHIEAQNIHDLYMVVGYLSAQDRLWQMDLLRRVTQGRLSEIFGKDMVDTDVLLRKLRMPDNSAKLYKTLADSVKNPLIYFAQGVNAYIKDQQDDLPFEFKVLGYQPEKWQPEQSLNLVGYMAWNLELGYKMEGLLNYIKDKVTKEQFAELLPDYDAMKTYVYPDFSYEKSLVTDTTLVAAIDKLGQISPDIFNGSNNWAVSGQKSTTGKPIFSNDMHLALNIPGIWTRMHLMIPGKLNVTGVVLPGEPFVVAGHNGHIAWGMTNVMLDGADFYVETLNPENEAQYKFNGQWRDMMVKHEKIYVKGQEEPVEKTLYFTHRGPIFTSFDDVKTMPVSMHWVGNEDSREIETLQGLATAKNWDDFTKAIRGFKSVSQNIAYADVDGNIGLHMTGRVPERIAPGYLFFPGDTDKYDWKRYVPFDSLPFEYNPARGFVSSANNKTISDEVFPYYISEWYDVPYRIKRIRQMLNAKEKLSTEDFRQMLDDHHSIQADEIKPVMLSHLKEAKDLNKDESAGLSYLENWDNVYSLDGAAPAIFDMTLIKLVKNLVSDQMDEAAFKLYNKSL
ncbi:MAG TPA: penicillin acylase family protein, partial [Flavobacteriales bacterium]|nr:penicillin acylase family protein [Flavobacteriales bacterium]